MTLDLLKSIYEIAPFEKSREIYYREDKTPAHRFLYLYSIAGNDALMEVDVRDYKEANALKSFIKTAGKYMKQVKKSILKIDDVKFEGIPFDALILLPGAFVSDGEESKKEAELIKKTILAFPIYSCEFSGNETKEDVQLLRRDFIVTIDWKRKPAPIAKMRFNNFKTGVKSKGKERGYTSMNDVLTELGELKDEKSFIEMENYKGEVVTIRYTKKSLVTSDTKDNILNEGSSKVSKEFINYFLLSGLK